MYAVIATGGKQYKVSEGETVRVEKLGVEAAMARLESYRLQVQEKNRIS